MVKILWFIICNQYSKIMCLLKSLTNYKQLDKNSIYTNRNGQGILK